DVLTTTLTPRRRNADWTHWQTARAPGAVAPGSWLRSFNPILRASRVFAKSYIAAIEAGGWDGHNEFTIPTIARHLGFQVADIAG
ncbi:hypothetical protein, partial [Salmonella enterica]|uniref:hypothetical protein n=1 Tax=Salmonella enterica TaxID=28901 RepID=UPI003297245B